MGAWGSERAKHTNDWNQSANLAPNVARVPSPSYDAAEAASVRKGGGKKKSLRKSETLRGFQSPLT